MRSQHRKGICEMTEKAYTPAVMMAAGVYHLGVFTFEMYHLRALIQKNTHYQQLVLMTQGVHPASSRTSLIESRSCYPLSYRFVARPFSKKAGLFGDHISRTFCYALHINQCSGNGV